ncbi:DMT family transporter [Pokkaliibacter sp. CJK22405]|uniref:DMT family transporter n=1 Tax=Pokkaliibacter sp. CJK22405 TaxID=3384615 RepID=UPI0039851C1C
MNSPLLLSLVPWLFVVLWSTGFIGAKFGLPYVEPFNFLFIRMLLTLGVFALLILIKRTSWPTRRQIGHQLVVGALVHGLYLGGVFAAIQAGLPAGMTAIIVGTQPLVTALVARLWLNERLNSLQMGGVALGLVGVVLVVMGRGSETTLNVAGVLWALAALVGMCIGTLYQKRFSGGAPLLTGTFCQYVSAALLTGVMSFSLETREVVWSANLVMALGWLVIGLSLAAILLLMVMIQQGEASKVASYFYLVPPLTAVEGWLLFDEHLSLVSISGMLLATLAVWLVVARKPAESKA